MAQFSYDEFRAVAFREALRLSVWRVSPWLLPLVAMSYFTRHDAWFSGCMAGAAGMVVYFYLSSLLAMRGQYLKLLSIYRDPIEISFMPDGIKTASSVRTLTLSRSIILEISMSRTAVTLTPRIGEPILIPRESLSESELDWIREFKTTRSHAT